MIAERMFSMLGWSLFVLGIGQQVFQDVCDVIADMFCELVVVE